MFLFGKLFRIIFWRGQVNLLKKHNLNSTFRHPDASNPDAILIHKMYIFIHTILNFPHFFWAEKLTNYYILVSKNRVKILLKNFLVRLLGTT